jgi:hypothetical protein
MQPAEWWTEANQDLSMEIGDLRLVVQALRDGESLVHFMVFRHSRADVPDVLVASGTAEDIRAAKEAVIRASKRYAR